MKITCIVNDTCSPPGIVGEVVGEQGFELDVVNPHAGRGLADDLLETSAGLVVLGGIMHAFEDDRYPALARIAEVMAAAHRRKVPVLGICLGAQLLARALGRDRVSMPAYELGFVPLETTEAGRGDRLLRGLDVPPIMQAHEDNFALPEGAELLLTGEFCRNQAFRAGRTSYAFQGHFEVTLDVVQEWIRQMRTLLAGRLGADPQAVLDAVARDVETRLAPAQSFARTVTGRWLEMAGERAARVAA